MTAHVDVVEHLGNTSYVYAHTVPGEQIIIEQEERRHAAATATRSRWGFLPRPVFSSMPRGGVFVSRQARICKVKRGAEAPFSLSHTASPR